MTYPFDPEDRRNSNEFSEEEENTGDAGSERIEADATENETEGLFEPQEIPELDGDTNDSSRAVVLPPLPSSPRRASGSGNEDVFSRERLDPPKDPSSLPELPT